MLNQMWKQGPYVVVTTLLLALVMSPVVLAANKGIQWEKSLEKGMAEAKKTGKPIMMDFFTEW